MRIGEDIVNRVPINFELIGIQQCHKVRTRPIIYRLSRGHNFIQDQGEQHLRVGEGVHIFDDQYPVIV